MLGKVVQSPAWKQQGHVCLACRRHQRIRALQQRQHLRHNSSLAHASSSSVADEWFNNLNDISDNYGKPSKSRLSHRPSADAESEQKTTKRSTADHPPMKGLDILKASSNTRTVEKREGRLTATRRQRIKYEAKQDAQRKTSKVPLKPQNVTDLSKALARDVPDLSTRKSSADELQQLIVNLRKETEVKAAQQDVVRKECMDKTLVKDGLSSHQELEEDLSPKPFPTFTSASTPYTPTAPTPVDSVTVPAGQTLRETTREANAGKQASEKKYKAKTSPAASGLGRRLPSSDAFNDSFSSRFKTQRIQNAYGVAKAPRDTSAGASFASFRNADRVSPDLQTHMSVAATPFGMRASRDDTSGQSATLSTSINASSSPENETTKGMTFLLGQLNQTVKGKLPFSIGRKADDVVGPNGGDHQVQISSAGEQEHQKNDQAFEEQASPAMSRNRVEDSVLQIGSPDQNIDASEEPLNDSADVADPAHARLANLHNSRYMQDDTDRACSTKKIEERPSDSSPSTMRASNTEPPLHVEYAANAGADQSSGASLTAANAPARAPPQAPATGSGSAGSGDDGSDKPSGDASGVSIAQAMKSSRQGRIRRARRAPSKGSTAVRADEGHTSLQEHHDSQTEQGDSIVASISPSDLHIEPIDIPQPHVPYLEYGLDRVLFNPGIYQLQDPASRVYNFDPYLENIMPVNEFDFNSLKEYKTSSQDKALSTLAKEHDKKYIGSTSSMTSSLAQFHYLLSNWRPINLGMLSNDFVSPSTKTNMTEINRAPSAIFLRWKNGTYAIDADKEYDGANVLMLLGKSMELLLTLPKSEYERYRKSDPRQVPEEQKTAPESYQYTTMRDFLMRSQLDAYDPRLPDNGTFDLKTRAVVSVRMQAKEFEPMTGYEIFSLHGKWNSYEREYYDMMRSTMLKYMLQARMGRMNGIFVAYHNVKRIFGFQYISMQELDRALHGQADTCLGDQEFRASLDMLNEVLNKATAKFPEQSLRFHFETQQEQSNGMPTSLHVFAEPMADEDIDRIQNSGKAKIAAFEREIMGKETEDEVDATTAESASISTKSNENENALAATDEADLSTGSSDADADTKFLGAIEASSDEDLKPLFYATIIVQSRVNGEIPDEDRPKNLKKDDKWEIDYILKEYQVSRHQWALYEDMKARRKFAFAEAREDEDEGDPESEGQSKRADGFIQMLRGLSDKSRETRVRLDKMDAGKEQVWVEEELSRDRENIDGVKDYMDWLYKARVEA